MPNWNRYHSKITKARMMSPRFDKNRKGIASLEFVLGLPFLVLIAAIIFTVAFAAVNKISVVSESRHAIWKMRKEESGSSDLEESRRNTETKPMVISSEFGGGGGGELPGEVSGIASTKFKTYQWLGGEHETKSGTTLIFGTWDHKEIKEFTDNPDGPHLDVLGRVRELKLAQSLINMLNRLIRWAL